MVNIAKVGDSAVKFTFTDNDHYLFNGEIEVPLNSLLLILDESDMVTFKKIDGDPFVSFLISNSNFDSKEALETFYKENMVGSTGGGLTPEEAQEMIDDSISGKADTSAVTESINAAVSGKQDTLSAGTNITISGNVISAEGKAIEAGRGIAIATGATADTVSFNLPISAGTGTNSIVGLYNSNTVSAKYSVAFGMNNVISGSTNMNNFAEGSSNKIGQYSDASHAEGNMNKISGYTTYSHVEGYGNSLNLTSSSNPSGIGVNFGWQASHAEGCNNNSNVGGVHLEGYHNTAKNYFEHASGTFNNSVSASTAFGNSGNTLFSVGNGTADNARHNAFEIRQNGDIYITSGGTDIKLQDNLGGGGGNNVIEVTQAEYDALVTAGTVDLSAIYVITDAPEIDMSNYYTSAQTNSAITAAVSGKMDTSAFTAYSASTDARISEDEEVTARALVEVNDALGGLKLQKLTQAQYDALVTKDNSTVYIIVN